ncbi:type IV secretion system protein VirB3 [Rhizobiales bacterium GAS188]|nr:type IV secretion system protein VirB3 [Rhizobiales bacterium GAS188]
MTEEVRPVVDPIVIGLTRPPMMFGVPYVVFVIETMIIVLVFINTKNLLMFGLIVPLHAIGYVLTVRDARFVDVIMTAMSRCPPTRNRPFWGADAYSP